MPHPAAEQLSDFGLGKLNDVAAAAIAQHLAGCESCRRALDRLPGDTFLRMVRAATVPASLSPSSPTPVTNDRNLTSLAAAPAPQLPPELIKHPKYRFVRELGRGGMGVVYQAEHIQMERLVAIKVINRSVLDHPQALERFAREVRAAARLSHPNIVAAYDFEQAGDLRMLVMEFVEGRTLAQELEYKGPLPIINACHYVRQAALGLQHAHEKGMVHRDLKPQNLMLTPKGTVKLLDMGLARVTSDKTDAAGLTGVGATLGTPDYIAPEQAMDAATADIRSDIYSLGCTLYCLLGGRPPFAEGTPMQRILAHREKEPLPLADLRPEVSAKLTAVVARMMAKDPAQRYQTPVEVVQALAPFCKAAAKGAAVAPAADSATSVAARPTTSTRAATHLDSLTDTDAAGSVLPAAKKKQMIGRSAIGVALLALVVLTGLVGLWVSGLFKVKTPDGTIVLENVPADAEVLVDGGVVTVKSANGETVEIRVAPSRKHRLEVKKAGFKAFGEEVELAADGRKSVIVRLEPVMPLPDPTNPNLDPDRKAAEPVATPRPSAALEALRRDRIPPEALELAGDGDPNNAPTSLVAVLGEVQPIHTGFVLSLAYSLDGRWLASASADRTIILRNTATGRVQRILKGHAGAVSAVAFSKDGRTLVSAGHDGTLRLWSINLEVKPMVVDAKMGHQVIHTMAVSPDGRFVAAGGESGLIKLWKWGMWEEPIEFASLAGKVRIHTLAFSPDGELLACGGDKETNEKAARVRIYTTADWSLKKNMMHTGDAVFGLAFSHDGKHLASVGAVGNGSVFEVTSGKQIAVLLRKYGPGEWPNSYSVAWSPDDKTLAVGEFMKLAVYDFPTGTQRTGRFEITLGEGRGYESQPVRAVAFSPRGDMLAAAGQYGDMPVWDTSNWKLQYLERGHRHSVSSIAISPDGAELLSIGDGAVLLRWPLARPREPVVRNLDFSKAVPPHMTSLVGPAVAYSRDGKTFVIAWHAGMVVRNILTDKETVISAAPFFRNPTLSPDGQIIAAGGDDGYLHLWDLASGKDIHRFETKGRWSGLAFSRDGGFLIAGNEETKKLTIWNVATGTEHCSWEVKSVTGASAFDPRGKIVATGHEDGSVLLWDTATGQKVRTLAGHSGRVRSLKFSPDGKTLVSSANDGTIRLWNPDYERARAVIPLGPANRQLIVDLDPSGRYLFAAGNFPVIFVLRLP